MSYSIVYNRVVIKNEDEYVFLVLIGDNNCYEANNRRRSRDWCILTKGTEEEVMDYFNRMCGGKYQEHFMLHGKWVDDEKLLRWAKNGIKNAHTAEEVVKASGFFSVAVVYYAPEEQCGKKALRTNINTNEEFKAWLKDADSLAKTLSCEGTDCCYVFNIWEKISFPKEAVPFTGTAIIKYGKGYISDVTPEKLSVAYDIGHAKIYNSYDEAADAVKVMKMHYRPKQGRIISAEKALKMDADRKYGIRITRKGMTFGYFVRASARGYRYTCSVGRAHRFTEKEANKKINEIFWGEGLHPNVELLPDPS